MSLYETIGNAWKEAMKARDPKKDTFAAIRTEAKNKVISARTLTVNDSFRTDHMNVSHTPTVDPTDEQMLEVLRKMAKQRRESITEYEKGGRADLVAKEQAELAVIESFLPQQMSKEELQTIIKMTLTEIGATSTKDIGRAMKAVMEKVSGKADGKIVQVAVKELLA